MPNETLIEGADMLRMSLITLGVADVEAATAFYEKFGLRKSSASQDSVSFFQLGPTVLGLFGAAT